MRKRIPTVDIERLAKSVEDECRLLMTMVVSPRPSNGAPLPPMPDPGTGPGFTRRTQAKHDYAFWMEQRDNLLNRLGELIAEGRVTL